jgi:hypothetical protein
MVYLDECANEQTVLLQHPLPELATAIKKFFADAGQNSVRAFYDSTNRRHGYVFRVHTSETGGNWYAFVAFQLNPSDVDARRFERQFTHHEWFSGPFSGPPDSVHG